MVSQQNQIIFTMPSAKGKVWLWVLAGFGLTIASLIGVYLAMQAAVIDHLQFHLRITFPMTMAIYAFINAWYIFRSPWCLVVDDQGIGLLTRKGTFFQNWSAIGWSTVQGHHHFGKARRHYDIFDNKGKRIVRVSDEIDNFDLLVDTVKAHIAQAGNPATEQVQLNRARRSAWVAFPTALLLGAGSIFIAWDGWNNARSERLLTERGQPGQAEILRRFLAPDGRTPRLEYRITNLQGQAGERNAELLRPVWDALEGKTHVPVLFVPDEPSINRLMFGEVLENEIMMKPPACYVMAGLGVLITLFLLVYGVMNCYGWGIDLDSKTGKISIKRFGEGT